MRRTKVREPRATEGWTLALRQELADPATRMSASVEVGDWARDLCLMMGSEIRTAYFVGGQLAHGLTESWREDERAGTI